MATDLTNRTGYIYMLTAPNDKIYIGQTIDARKRKSNYKNKPSKGQIKLWRSCEKYNWSPADTFTIIEECLCGENKCNLNEREIYWIAFYDSFNNGLNCNMGGGSTGGMILTEEHKQKLSQAKLGKKRTEESRRKQSETNKGHSVSTETREKLSEMFKGRKQHPNTNRTGMKHSEEIKKKCGENNIGRIPWNKGILCSDETKEKLKQANLGRKHSEESKEKMRQAKLKKKLEQNV